MRRLHLTAALLLVLSLALGACSSETPDSEEIDASQARQGSSAQNGTGQDPASDTNAVAAPDVLRSADKRPLAPEFTVGTGNGSSFSLKDRRGEVVVLYFSFPG